MSTLKKYKKLEGAAFSRVSARFGALASFLGAFFAGIRKAGKQKLTVMFIPHTEKRIFNLQLSFFGLAGIIFAFGLVILSLTLIGASFGDTTRRLDQKSAGLKTAQADLDAFRDETGRVIKAAKKFEAALAGTLSRIGLKPAAQDPARPTGDLASLLDMEERSAGTLREIDELRSITDYLESSVDPLNELGAVVSSQSSILTEIPQMWPIKGGVGHISMYYGQNIHPLTGQWYIHKGVDLSTFRAGDPVVAAADGKIVSTGYSKDFGNSIIIQHKHGFYTRYAHLQSYKVVKGERVQQGQVIGYIGNTGISTGPHLHFEVHLGTDVIDPLKFLSPRTGGLKSE